MIYTRGSRHDFDSWRDKGALGWAYNNVIPYFRKVEKAGENVSISLGKQGVVPITKDIGSKFVDFVIDAVEQIGMVCRVKYFKPHKLVF